MTTSWYTGVDGLRSDGFTGFVTVRDLRASKLSCVPGMRDDIGFYVMLRMQEGLPTFLSASTGGHFKGRDPNVALDMLRGRWIADSPIVYIGKAGAPGKSATLRSRLKQYLDFGAGRPIGHWGGRYTMASAQLCGSCGLLEVDSGCGTSRSRAADDPGVHCGVRRPAICEPDD